MQRTVGELIGRASALRTGPKTPVGEVARLMTDGRCGSVLVMDGERLVGIFTEHDALRRVLAAGKPPETPVDEVMSRDPDTIEAGASPADAIRKMDEFYYWHLPVTEDGKVIGVVSIRDLPFGAAGGIEDEIERRHELAERMW
jgi:CBS domain-containing protein